MFHIATQASFVLSENAQTLLVDCVFARNFPWLHAILFGILFSQHSATPSGLLFLSYWVIKKHEGHHSSIKHGPKCERKCFPQANIVYWLTKDIRKNNCVTHAFEREHSLHVFNLIWERPYRVSLRKSGTLRLSPEGWWVIMCVERVVLRRGHRVPKGTSERSRKFSTPRPKERRGCHLFEVGKR